VKGVIEWEPFDGQGIAKLKWPERLVPLAEMPMTPTRKVIKSALVKLLSA